MRQCISEQLDIVSEGVMDSVMSNVADYVRNLYNDQTSTAGRSLKKYVDRGLVPQKGYVDHAPQLVTQAGTDAYRDALDRGAFEGAAMGGFGGLGLGFGLAGKGALSSTVRGAAHPFSQQFDKDFVDSRNAEIQRLQAAGDPQRAQQVASRRAPNTSNRLFRSGRGAIGNLIGNLILKGAGSAIGLGSGALAGWAGGRETGAAIGLAGTAAAPLGLIGQPLAALGALAGGAIGGAAASNIEDARKKLEGGPDRNIFRMS